MTTAAMDASPPRRVNGQAVLLRRGPDGDLEVLLQRRSERMPVMPGYLATVGGMCSSRDPDSRYTTMREVSEETGLLDGVVAGPAKFAEGARCDWYVLLLDEPRFEPCAKDRWECDDIRKSLPFLPASSTAADCFGHAWVPVDCLGEIDESLQPLMGGLLHRVRQAVDHLRALNTK